MMANDDIIEAEEDAADRCCTNCGMAEIDDIKLKDCDKCDLARYCGDKCQEEHLQAHEAACKERAAEFRDELLFRQPDSTHLGDCPICFLPLPLGDNKSTMYSCCGKVICIGCVYANTMRQMEQRLKYKCPFCRKLLEKTDDEAFKRLMKRAEANDPVALRQIGAKKRVEGDYDKAFKYLMRAAELGDPEAHHDLADIYRKGEGVENNEERAIYHCEEAAIAGDPIARYNLGCHEQRKGRYDRAAKHWIIAANLGDNDSMNMLKKCYKYGHVSKDDLASALRAHHAAIEATKSPQREAEARYTEYRSAYEKITL